MTGHDELISLLGAYALDAVSDDERRAVEEHLAGCATCGAEVARHQEVAAALGSTAAATAPDDLWAAIRDHLDDGPTGEPAPPALPGLADRRVAPTEAAPADPGPGREPGHDPGPGADGGPVTTAPAIPLADRRRRPLGWMAGLAAAAVVIVVLAASVVQLSRTNTDLERQLAAASIEDFAAAALRDPANRVIRLGSDTGEATATAVVTPSGDGYLVGANLAPLHDDQTYQLWTIGEQGPVSLGVLGNEVGSSAFRIQGPIGTLAITAERAGGVPAPEGTPLVTSPG